MTLSQTYKLNTLLDLIYLSPLSNWEEDFLYNLNSYTENQDLSPRQIETLENLYTKYSKEQ